MREKFDQTSVQKNTRRSSVQDTTDDAGFGAVTVVRFSDS